MLYVLLPLGEVFIWNAIKGETYVELKADDNPTLAQWNPNGVLLGVLKIK